MENKNYGYQEDSHDSRDIIFGGALAKKVLRESGQWEVPAFEKQRKGGFDTFGCISFGTLNVVEIIEKVKFGIESNYSDRYLSKTSQTSRSGNTPRKVYQALRKQGAVNEKDYAFNAIIWEEYYEEISSKLLSKGKIWASEYSFGYARVGTTPEEMKEALKYSPLGIGIYAWAKNSEGIYYQPEGARPNHFCVLIGYEEGKYWTIFDTYEESVKKLAWGYPFSYVASYTLEKKKTYPTLKQNLLRDFFKLFSFKRT